MTVLLDAGPALNFLAVSQQDILIKLASRWGTVLHVPERVHEEILAKASNDSRFQRTPAVATWRTLHAAARVVILSDDITDSRLLEEAVSRVSDRDAHDRVRQGKDLGEIMVLAHASVLAQAGADVGILMDETDGRRRAAAELRWLVERNCPGRLSVWATEQVLRGAQSAGWIPQWEEVYDKMRPFDDGLPPRK